MKKLTQFSSIIISYIANVAMLVGDYFMLEFMIRSYHQENDLGEGIGMVLIAIIGIGIFIIGLIAKAITLPATITFFIDALKNKVEHSKRWVVAHIVDYIIFVILLGFFLFVIINNKIRFN